MGNIIVILTLFHEEQGQGGTVLLHLYSLKNSLKDGRTSENK